MSAGYCSPFQSLLSLDYKHVWIYNRGHSLIPSNLAYEHYSLNCKKQFKYTPLARFIIFFIVDNYACMYARSHRGYTCSGITGYRRNKTAGPQQVELLLRSSMAP